MPDPFLNSKTARNHQSKTENIKSGSPFKLHRSWPCPLGLSPLAIHSMVK